MNFDLDPGTAARRLAAEACARDVLGPLAATIDATADIPAAALAAAGAALPPPADGVAWVVVVEALATASGTAALAAAAAALSASARASAQWAGLRGLDVDALRSRPATDRPWSLAVSAAIVGGARVAVEASVSALKAARAAGTPNDAAQASVSDAATAVDAARLLLWHAAGQSDEAGVTARALARLHALESAPLAFSAAELAAGPDLFRPGSPLERVRRDAVTTAQVLGDPLGTRHAAAAGTLPG